MSEWLSESRRKYVIRSGELCFSPVLEVSASEALDYCTRLRNNKLSHVSPYFFSFPDKQAASLWLTISLLTNFFFEDYVDANNEVDFTLENGDLVDVYGSILRFVRYENNLSDLIFSSSDIVEGIRLPASYKSIFKRMRKKRVNKHKHYKSKQKNIKSNRNAISKILEPDDSIIINEQVLISKVLLVTGRGTGKRFREDLNNHMIFNESLKKIYREENLIIKPDLEGFIPDNDYQNKQSSFISQFQRWEDTNDNSTLQEDLKNLNYHLQHEGVISEEFSRMFDEFVDNYKDLEDPRVKFFEDHFPGYQKDLFKDLKAVVINDIKMVETYPETLNYLLIRKIPVIVVTDRQISELNNTDVFNSIFSDSEYLGVNWNRRKIIGLAADSHLLYADNIETAEPTEKDKLSKIHEEYSRMSKISKEKDLSNIQAGYLDYNLWNQCLRYVLQKVTITVYDGNVIDQLLLDVQRTIPRLEGYNVLKTKYYELLQPAAYALKNSQFFNNNIGELLDDFDEVYSELKKEGGLNHPVVNSIDAIINAMRQFEKNIKPIESLEDVYANFLLQFKGKELFVPTNATKTFLPNAELEKIVFTGFPYMEYRGQYLLKSVLEHYIPSIKIHCWHKEAEVTRNFLRKKLKNGYFKDRPLKDGIVDGNLQQVKTNDDIDFEIDEMLEIKNLSEETVEEPSVNIEEDLSLLHGLRYAKYSSSNDQAVGRVMCNVVSFTDGSYLFLPGNSLLIAEEDTGSGRKKVKTLQYNQLDEGVKVFHFERDRQSLRTILKNVEPLDEDFEELESWKMSLFRSYASVNANMEELENYFLKIKDEHGIIESNPIRSNISRWLFDEEILAPSKSNLIVILYGDSEFINDDVSLKSEKIHNSRQKISGHLNSISRRIKKVIAQKLNDEVIKDDDKIDLNIGGSLLQVHVKTISTLEKNGVMVNYDKTRKILC